VSDPTPPGGPIRGPESWFTSDDQSGADLTLPHWTEPGTGQIDATEASGPRWRDGADDYNELDDIRLLDPTPPAKDPMEQASEVFFGLDMDDEPPPAPAPQRQAPLAAPLPTSGRAQRSRAAQAAPAAPAVEPPQAPAGSSDRNVVMATVTGLGLAVVALGSLYLGEVPGLIVSTAILALATAEFYNAMRIVGYNPATLLGIGTTIGLNVAVYWKNTAAYPVVLFAAIVCALLWYLMRVSGGRPAHSQGCCSRAIRSFEMKRRVSTSFSPMARDCCLRQFW